VCIKKKKQKNKRRKQSENVIIWLFKETAIIFNIPSRTIYHTVRYLVFANDLFNVFRRVTTVSMRNTLHIFCFVFFCSLNTHYVFTCPHLRTRVLCPRNNSNDLWIRYRARDVSISTELRPYIVSASRALRLIPSRKKSVLRLINELTWVN